ncbi:zinc-finger homeodomain protein 5-like [Andrographis paniculata]|uniref:zinc-finger homeodomain protein 5-like n=1 Tax=Andrographis paniculata TaxID=175694 RepID=UPI0021E7786C|nr:zinc-finger homeodomain protein 5-like [Andrographis paniculata]XP_051145377.1 zinc-finger homeodomain protein 5-like [Andrographis paniculata]XP_051145378.1 zinc-finger homeodomain protein 5-like [Andrographis paniculata]XP_051145379.1 zinc-finger homeodomain protein 5-like [Andrographis paniculata]
MEGLTSDHPAASAMEMNMIMFNQQQQQQDPINMSSKNDHHQQHKIKKALMVEAESQAIIRYKECLKNHAAAMGVTATDGCGEFMPSGRDDTPEALICSACACHRNFHRQQEEILTQQQQQQTAFCPRIVVDQIRINNGVGNKKGLLMSPDDRRNKRFRTKFSKEQKERMVGFAERIGWRMQKQDEGLVQQFCQEIGVRIRVFKVWMHNNKKINLHNNNNTHNHVNGNGNGKTVVVNHDCRLDHRFNSCHGSDDDDLMIN